jgi:predicted DCC family thiol-disulfide oxidoreductase YuxK
MSQQPSGTEQGKSKILFDGNCVVCDLEISHYKRLAPDLFELIDISSPSFDAARYGLTKQDVDRDMHVLTPEGELCIGVDAFAHIWSRLGRYRKLAPLINYPCAKAGYKVFTKVRPYLPKKKR